MNLPIIDVLVTGRCSNNPAGATGTVTLINKDDLRLIIDAGDPWNAADIVSALTDRGIRCDQITHVVVTHGHVDHCANLSLFTNARIVMDADVTWRNKETNKIEYESIEKWPYCLSNNLKIQKLSGHTASDLIVEIQNNQYIDMIVGDLIESQHENGEEFAINKEELAKSQKYILSKARFIVPGHGEMFKNELFC